MKTTLRKTIVLFLAIMMVVTAMPVYALAESSPAAGGAQDLEVQAQAVSPAKVNEAVTKFADVIGKFTADTSKMGDLQMILTRFGGVTSFASGAICILQMFGIIKDPTLAKLGQILDTVKDIQTQLKQMDQKLDDITQQIIDVSVSIEEKDRANKATTMLSYWRNFETSYREPLDDRMKEYQGYVNEGIRAWWKESSHDGVLVCYTRIKGAPSLTYTSNYYADGLPSVADNGESVDPALSFGVPAEYMPNTRKNKFDINKYQQQFETEMANSFVTAANAHKLDANAAFYKAWDALGANAKAEKAKAYAADILRSQTYLISCDEMSSHHQWVISVANAYRKYSDNILKKDSGVDAMINAMYLTHAFEKETKDDLILFCDGMIAQAGLYGEFALGCVCQDDMQSEADKAEIQGYFANAINGLDEKKRLAITGYDDFCYITGSRVRGASIDVCSEATIDIEPGKLTAAFRGCSSKGWELSSSQPFMNGVCAKMLYHHYKGVRGQYKDFRDYIYKNTKSFSDKFVSDSRSNYDGTIMTKFSTQQFALSEGILMDRIAVIGQRYFYPPEVKINVGNSSDVKSDCFRVHDKVLYDAFDMKTGNLAVNQLCAARAIYGESQSGWMIDEAFIFKTKNVLIGPDKETKNGHDYLKNQFIVPVYVFLLYPGRDTNGGGDNDPFDAFGGVSLSQAQDVPIVPEAQKPSLTGVKLKSGTFTYTGKAIRPKVVVKSGKKTVPASGYKVSYSGNKQIGPAMITVRGKGKYTGQLTKRFDIVPKGTAIKKIKRKKKTAVVKWKAQKAKMPSRRISGYQIRYSTSPSMKNAKTVKVKGYKKTGKKIRKLKKNKKYYFQIRTYMTVGKATIYSKWSKKKAVK